MNSKDQPTTLKLSGPPKELIGKYKHLYCWCKMMGSYDYYIGQQLELAEKEGAPTNAIYRAPIGGWITADQIGSKDTKEAIDRLMDLHFGAEPTTDVDCEGLWRVQEIDGAQIFALQTPAHVLTSGEPHAYVEDPQPVDYPTEVAGYTWVWTTIAVGSEENLDGIATALNKARAKFF